MATMTTKRCYWVDWICTFDKNPSEKELKTKQARLVKYLKIYLKALSTKPSKKSSSLSGTIFGEEMLEWNEKKLMWIPLPPNPKASSGITGTKKNWIAMLKWEWDQLSFNPLVFNFKAYFDGGKGIRFTPDVRGSMTPPPPPPPPGDS